MIEIKKKNPKKLTGKSLAAAIVAGFLALLIIAYAVITALLPTIVSGGNQTTLPELIEGEAHYGTNAVAYPTIAQTAIQSVSVLSSAGDFYMKRPEKNQDFIFYYTDEYGKDQVYYPPICSEEEGFDYSSLYAIEAETGLNVQKITYLCTTLGYLYFTERIPIVEETRAAQLNRYGLNAEDRDSIYFTYLDSEGKEQAIHIYVGDQLVVGTGYYYMINGRDYIYTSISNGFDYALSGFESLVSSSLIAPGLSEDGTYEPYLTPAYNQWKNTVYSAIGDLVTDDAEVIIMGDMLTTLDKGPSHVPSSGELDGYDYDGVTERSMDLEYLKGRPEFSRLIKTLVGRAVGDYSAAPIVSTVIMNTNEVELTDGVSGKYSYYITAIESVLTDSDELTAEGTPVGSATLVKVKYNYFIDGKLQNNAPCHAVIDLAAESVVPAETREKLSSASVGELSEVISFEATYNTENAQHREVKYIISDINLVYNSKYEYAEVIAADSIVNYTFYYEIDGVQVGDKQRNTVNLAEITEGVNLEIKNRLLGRRTGNGLNIVGYTDMMYCEPMQNFVAYTIKEIEYFVDRELIVAFSFVNSVDRDPFYGESLYINKLTNKYKTYALNAESCESVVRILGGITADGSSQLSEGLAGSETVAVGLTPVNMLEYGLYAHTIYFELPRGIIPYGNAESEYDSYRWLSSIGFHLYISELQPDGTRFVGSDMYDIVVKIDGKTFEFIEHSFVDFWARKSLVMIDYQDVDSVKLEFNLEDIEGKYNFRLEHQDIYIGTDGGHYDEEPEAGGTLYDFVTVHASVLSGGFGSELEKYLSEENLASMKLENLYNRVAGIQNGYGLTIGNDTAGTAYFKEILLMMYATYYTGTLTDEEQTAALATAPKVMSVSFTVTDSSPYPYVYDFYRISDRRVMVVISQQAPDGTTLNQVSDFYISTFAFKKIANGFISLLNGKEVDSDIGYID